MGGGTPCILRHGQTARGAGRPMPNIPTIPYGWSDFAAMRRERCLYVDKTRFLQELESERFAFLVRPRRFGKSCWVSLLENYCGCGRAAQFEELFGGTEVGRRPTGNRHRYVVLRFDFSVFDDTLETLVYCDAATSRHREVRP